MKFKNVMNKETGKIRQILGFCLMVLFLFASMPAEAQFYKKMFKKRAKTEKKTGGAKVQDGIDDSMQQPLADIATADNQNNRNAFMDIPLGIKADRFEQQLLQQGFTTQKRQGPQTAKSYIYEGEVYGSPSVVSLITSEQTARVYAVDVEEVHVYSSEQEVRQRFQSVKAELVKRYGQGFADNQGEAYVIQTRLGTVTLHYERGTVASSYTLGLTIDDAKAYLMAYNEMEDKTYETVPRPIDNGLAPACRHTDIVGLAVSVLQARTQAKATAALKAYEYIVGRATAKMLPASFKMGDYQVSLSAMLRKKTVTSVSLTATDDLQQVEHDLQTGGFETTDRKTWRQGRLTLTVTQDKSGKIVLTLR